jgi:hypothetical protein
MIDTTSFSPQKFAGTLYNTVIYSDLKIYNFEVVLSIITSYYHGRLPACCLIHALTVVITYQNVSPLFRQLRNRNFSLFLLIIVYRKYENTY